MPVRLDVGHPDPGRGPCLMEHVSELAGEPFGVRPRCTHPAVAALAAQFHGRVSPAGRAELAVAGPPGSPDRDRMLITLLDDVIVGITGTPVLAPAAPAPSHEEEVA